MPSSRVAGMEPSSEMALLRSYNDLLLWTISAMPVIQLIMLSSDTPPMLVRSLLMVMLSFSGASRFSTGLAM